MSSGDLAFMPLVEMSAKLKRRELSPVDVASAFLERIEQMNDSMHVYISVDPEETLRRAKMAEKEIRGGHYRGPLHGVPYACKDLFQTRNMPTTGGSRVLEGWMPKTDAAAIERITDAGGVLLGKTNLHEFAYGATGENAYYGTVPNPLDTTRLAGGSSSGSAAAVAAGLAAYALGTDTGGSVRAPAALCGVVGLKPTYGRISLHGVIPYCWSLDHAGIMGRSVPDVAMVLETLAGHDPRDPYSATAPVEQYTEGLGGGLNTLRIGVSTQFFFDRLDPQIEAAAAQSLRLLEKNGAKLIDVNLPSMKKTRTVSLLVQLPEMLSYHSRHLPEKKLLYGEDLRGGMALGQFILAEHYVRAKRMIESYRRQMTAVFDQVDILLTPSCPIVAPTIGSAFIEHDDGKEAVGNAITRFTSFFNMTGHPAITLPCGMHSSGLPMGVQLIGGYFEEKRLLGVASALEQLLAFHLDKSGDQRLRT